ncbi:unnamed protein product [Alternaria burnsii]|nr:unnamed protein product [Alternaria burnsii]
MSASVPRNYIPIDEPLIDYIKQHVLVKSTPAQQYFQVIKDHGPLPPNYNISLAKPRRKSKVAPAYKGPYFLENSIAPGTRNVGSWNHPCSPAESHLRPTFRPEPIDEREYITGTYHPPMPTYKAGKLIWKHHDSWESAISDCLNATGVKDFTGAQFTEALVRQRDQRLDELAVKDSQFHMKDTLYHPSDRGTAIFENEPNAARLAKQLGRNLVVLCPLTPASGPGWNRFWHRSNRPPIRYRWSVGEQACDKFMVVACLPKYVEGSMSKEAYWFTVTPATDSKATWDSHMKRSRDFGQLKKAFHFPPSLSTEKFIWTLVAAHRTYANNRLPRDTDLGRWIHQYGQYILYYIQPDVMNKVGFKLDTKSKYEGRRISFQELGAWILNSGASLKYVRLWEKENKALVLYWIKKTEEAWKTFSKYKEAASMLPE